MNVRDTITLELQKFGFSESEAKGVISKYEITPEGRKLSEIWNVDAEKYPHVMLNELFYLLKELIVDERIPKE